MVITLNKIIIYSFVNKTCDEQSLKYSFASDTNIFHLNIVPKNLLLHLEAEYFCKSQRHKSHFFEYYNYFLDIQQGLKYNPAYSSIIR
jgi:hypothetical protein